MPEFKLRKTMIFIEDIHHDGGPVAALPRRRAAIIALVSNPYAGRYVEDLAPGMEALKPLGLMMTDRLIEAMGGVEGIDAYGKAALAGEGGELEHSALWHVPG
ncbi:amino acid synthesis family protein, partial [Thioclava sp. BHET1]